MWHLFKRKPKINNAPIRFTNTLSGKKDVFVPLRPGLASFYSCGPTVYDRAHIGNLRAYVFSDSIARTLLQAGYHVRRVINVTDVGHLVGDGDEGEDKIAVGAKREKVTPEEIASRYARAFVDDLKELNIDTENILFPRATEYIKEQIAMIQVLEKKGHTYRTSDGLYFDTSTFPGYGKLGGIPTELIKEGDAASLPQRAELAMKSRIPASGEKRHPADFALWRKAKPHDLQQWNSPWGYGNPGWSIECSAMAKALLGETIDLHSGGIDHIPIHHNNEIAQSESATGKPLAHYWIHGAFLNVEGEKISKSLKNDIYLDDIVTQGFSPLALRYFFLQAHYRTPISFSWEALAAANEALHRLWKLALEIDAAAKGQSAPSNTAEQLIALMRDDLATPQALALLWESVRDEDLSPKEKRGVLEAADSVLGLRLLTPPGVTHPIPLSELPSDIQTLLTKREEARTKRDFAEADAIRVHIEKRGYRVEDTASGPLLTHLPE